MRRKRQFPSRHTLIAYQHHFSVLLNNSNILQQILQADRMAFAQLPNPSTAWRLDLPTSTRSTDTTFFNSEGFQKESESIIGQNGLTSFDVAARPDTGVYRSIIKIESRFENKKTGHSIWKIGTGWLIRPDLLVTSGDVVYDAEYQLGAATQVKCYIGYRGGDNSQVPPRYGQRVVTSAEWIGESDRRSRDIAFIQVAEPFAIDSCTCKSLDDVKLDQPEPVPEPQPESEPAPPLAPEVEEKISHPASQCSGCGGTCNSQVVVPPVEQTPVEQRPVEQPVVEQAPVQQPEIQPEVKPEETTEIPPVAPETDDGFEVLTKTNENTPATSVDESTAELDLFYETLKVISKVDIRSLDIQSPLLGPVGQFVSIVGGSLLGYIVGGEKIVSGELTKLPGIPEQALLAEAALQAVLAIEESTELDEILEAMKQNWNSNAPKVDQVAGLLSSYLTESALDIATYHMSDLNEQVRGSKKPKRRALGIRHFPGSDGSGTDFVKGLFGPTLPLAGREEVFSSVGPVLRSAVTAVKNLVSEAGKAAVDDLVPKILQKVASGSVDPVPVSTGPNEEATRVLLQRAIMADAALQAISALSKEKLDALKLIPLDSVTAEVEGIYDFIKRVLQKSGGIALLPAKHAVKKFALILIDAPPKPQETPQEVLESAEAAPVKTFTSKLALRDVLRGNRGTTRVL
ncbi:hypothetical protein FALBO_5388 [Fusarium albosuccineum]|uniref:Uncharacterized protein n=1 Tax=Fusarium albosuccineum TaxID=1237068 RepID=A0A8H4LFC5_9HYPO|nr:hypothetical protein FALBO_5388 [Fusarium albosuccineum]